MPNFDIPIPIDLNKELELPPCSEIRLKPPKPLKISLRRAIFQLSSNLGLLCLRPAAAHGGTPSRNNGAAQFLGGSDLCVFIVLPTLYRARLRCAGRPF